MSGQPEKDAEREILLAMHQAQADYESLKREHARLLSLASDTVGTADGALTLERLKKIHIALQEALDRYHAALQRFASAVLDRTRQE